VFDGYTPGHDIMGAMKERLRGVEILEPGFSKEAVRKNPELAHDWQWQEMAGSLYTWTDRFRNRLLNPIASLSPLKLSLVSVWQRQRKAFSLQRRLS